MEFSCVKKSPISKEITPRQTKLRYLSCLTAFIVFLLFIGGYLLIILIAVLCRNHDWDNAPASENSVMVQKVDPQKILTDALELKVRIPVGYFLGSTFWQGLYENTQVFAVLGAFVSAAVGAIYTDITEVSWKSDGSISGRHLLLTRLCASTFSSFPLFYNTIIEAFASTFPDRFHVPSKTRFMYDAIANTFQVSDKYVKDKIETKHIQVERGNYVRKTFTYRSFLVLCAALFALLYHTAFLTTEYFITLGEIGSPTVISLANSTGYELHVKAKPASFNMSRDWPLVGSRKCSLMSLQRVDHVGESHNVNALMGCGTHFAPASKSFLIPRLYEPEGTYQQAIRYHFIRENELQKLPGRVMLANTTQRSPVGDNNLILLVKSDLDKVYKSRGVLITLNPVVSLRDRPISDTQIVLELPTEEDECKTTNELGYTMIKPCLQIIEQQLEDRLLRFESLVNNRGYEAALNKYLDNRLLKGQIEDDPLVEFLESSVQFIFAAADYRLDRVNDTDRDIKGGMDFGMFTYGAHITVAFVCALIIAVFIKLTLYCWSRNPSIRQVTEIADVALISQLKGHSAAKRDELWGYRFAPKISGVLMDEDEGLYVAQVGVRAFEEGATESGNVDIDKVKRIAFDDQTQSDDQTKSA